MHFRRKLPSLTALAALEATVRLRSMTAAAKELGVTQAAVSRQIAGLERDFGRQLFGRGHRMLVPTPACQILAATLAEGFHNIAEAVDAMRANSSNVVTIGSTMGVSSFWLLPKLAELRQVHPEIQIRVISQDTKLALDTGDLDIVLRFGTPPFSDGEVIASRRDIMYPVCSPHYAAARDFELFPEGRWDFIETDVPSKSWYRWADWFLQTGRKAERLEPVLRFSYFTETIAAARAGQGIALGWDMLIRSHVNDGSLVKIGVRELVPEAAYNIVVPLGPKRTPGVELVGAWLAKALQHS